MSLIPRRRSRAVLEQGKGAVLVVIAGLAGGSKQVVGLMVGHRESEEAWSGLLRDLRRRGLRCLSVLTT
jgi:transposase-like protein